MNAAFDTHTIAGTAQRSYRPGGAAPLAATPAITAAQTQFEQPYTPMCDAAIVNGSQLERWHTPQRRGIHGSRRAQSP
jgi:hypothetical protein